MPRYPLHLTAPFTDSLSFSTHTISAFLLLSLPVGYQQKGLQTGFTMSSATFVPVGGGDVNINDIKPNGSSIDEGDVNIQTLDALGHTVATYVYYGDDMFDDDCPAGWYDDDGAVDVSFPVGTGLWIAAPDAETSLTFSGKVPTSDVVVVLRTGFTATANMMPTAVSIQDILPVGPSIDGGDVNIQTLDALGHTTATYVYYGEDMFDDDCPAGWYDDDGLVDVTFPAGTGLWVAAPDGETSITIPSPEL